MKRRGKPPPGIISAGGVDMARAHASNIRPAADTEMPPMETAKVVLSVETNPRRVQTMRNLEAGRPPTDGAAATDGASPWAQAAPAEAVDKNALPSATLSVDRDTVIPPARRREKQIAFWIRVATVMVALLLFAGVGRRVYLWTQRSAPPTPTPMPNVGGPLIPPPLPEETAAEASPSSAPSATGPRVAAPRPIDTDEPETEPTVRVIRVRPIPAPAPPKPSFTPLFETPEERKKN